MPQEISVQTLSEIKIKQLALNSDFGKLKFEKSFPYFQGLQALYKELDELDYKNNLLKSEFNEIDQSKNSYLVYLKRLQSFDIGMVNSQQLHDSLENEIENFYNDTVRGFRLIKLALEDLAAKKSKNKQELQKQQKVALQAEKEYKELSDKLKVELESLKEQKAKIESTKGDVEATRFGKYFSTQAEEYKEQAQNSWLKNRNRVFKWLIGIIIANLILYLVLFITIKLNWWPRIKPDDFFTEQYGIVKIALIAVLFYSLSFYSKHYKINSNLAAVNKHRQNVADTLSGFLASNPDDKDMRVEMIKQGTNAMFKHIPLGYVNDKGDDEGGPVQEIINYVTKSKNEI